MSQLGGGGGVEDGGTEQPPQQRTAGPRVSMVLKRRDLAMSLARLRGPLRFLNRRDPARDDEFSSLAWGGQELLGCLR